MGERKSPQKKISVALNLEFLFVKANREVSAFLPSVLSIIKALSSGLPEPDPSDSHS